MRTITIKRDSYGNTACIGRMTIEGSDFTCYTLEEAREGLERGQDLRIPKGEYSLRFHSPSRFEKKLRAITHISGAKMINVYNDDVPADRCILIHWGNTAKDTEGCILLGKKKVHSGLIGESIRACVEFYRLINDSLETNDISNWQLVIK